jgi:hypothetical protein
VVILLPAFFLDIVQNVLVVLQLVVKWIFTAILIWIFRCDVLILWSDKLAVAAGSERS